MLAGWATALSTDSVYEITHNPGRVIYECIVPHTAGASFMADLNNATPKWRAWAVEDYHWHQGGRDGGATPHEVWLGPASRAPVAL